MNKQNTQPQPKRKPDYRVTCPKETGDNKTKWVEIGAGWTAADGKAINIQLDALPVGQRLVIFPIDDNSAQSGGR